MSDEIVEIHVALLGEDIDVWKPVIAICVSGNVYRIIEQPYDREAEIWEFAPGAEVVCEERILSSQPALVAMHAHASGRETC